MKKSISASTAVKAAVGTGVAATAIVVPTVTLTGSSEGNETTGEGVVEEEEIATDDIQADLVKLGYTWKPIIALEKAKVAHPKTTEKELIKDLLFANQSDTVLFRRPLSTFDDGYLPFVPSLMDSNYLKKNYIKSGDSIEALLFFELGHKNNSTNDVQGVARWELAVNAGNQNVLITGFINLGTKKTSGWRISTFVDVLPPADPEQPHTVNDNKAIVVKSTNYESGNQTFTIKNPLGSKDWSVNNKPACSSCVAIDNNWTWSSYAGIWKPNTSSSTKLLDVITSTESNKFGLLNSSYTVETSNKTTQHLYSQDSWRTPADNSQGTNDLKDFTDKAIAGLKDRKGSWVSISDYCNELKQTVKKIPREPKNRKKERVAQVVRLCTTGIPNRN